jgi:hypothetical protein
LSHTSILIEPYKVKIFQYWYYNRLHLNIQPCNCTHQTLATKCTFEAEDNQFVMHIEIALFVVNIVNAHIQRTHIQKSKTHSSMTSSLSTHFSPLAIAVTTTAALIAGGVYLSVRDRGGAHGFSSSTTAQQVLDRLGADSVRHKRFLVTGCTPGGIGYETARVLALAGATVLVHARSEASARAVVAQLRRESGVDSDRCEPIWFDQSSLAQVVAAARALALPEAPALHGVALNAGLFNKELAFTSIHERGIRAYVWRQSVGVVCALSDAVAQAASGARRRARRLGLVAPSRCRTRSFCCQARRMGAWRRSEAVRRTRIDDASTT